jgi:Flp pilus assembly protein TadD
VSTGSSKTSASESGGLFSSPRQRSVILCLLLATLTLGIYNQVSHAQFINFDDDDYITNNPHVQAGLNGQTLAWAFSTTEAGNWHPLTWISHAIDCQIFHLNPAGHHYVNVLLHACNVILLFLLLQRGTGQTWRAMLVAAVFAVHPINVESVAWVAERKNVLSMLFFLLALAAYGWYVHKPGGKRYALVLTFFVLGLMSKPMVITLPFVLLLLDYWPLRRMNFAGDGTATDQAQLQVPRPSALRLTMEKIPLFLLSLASAVITMVVERKGNAVRAIFPFAVRFENALVSYVAYLGKAVWPSHLAILYPHPGNSIPGWTVAAATIFLLLVTAGAFQLRRHRYLIAGWLWFLGTLLPMIGLVQVGGQAMADRYAYLAFIGLFVAAVWGTADWAGAHGVGSKFLAMGGVAIVAALGAVTHIQENYWHDSVALWSHAIEVTRPNFAAQDNLGVALVALGRVDESTSHFESAVEINPLDWVGQLNVGVYEQVHGQVKEAMARYRIVLQQASDQRFRVFALENLGAAYRTLGDYSLARGSYQAALELSPADSFALVNLGIVTQKAGDFSQAAEYYSRAIQIQPSDIAYLLLAQAFEQTGRPQAARAALESAQKLSPDLDKARQNMNRLLTE